MADDGAAGERSTRAHNRIHVSPLSPYERRALDWLAPRLPAWVTPDMLTAFGLFGACVTCLGYGLCCVSPQFLWLASAGLGMHWFGDSLDGGLARYRRIERPRYGFFLDQNIDVFGNLVIVCGLAASPFVRFEPAALALFGYQALSIYVLVRFSLDGVFRLTVLNSGPTEVRVMLLVMNALILIFGAPMWSLQEVSFSWCDLAVGVFGLGCFGSFAGLIAVEAPLMREEDDRARRERAAAAPDDVVN